MANAASSTPQATLAPHPALPLIKYWLQYSRTDFQQGILKHNTQHILHKHGGGPEFIPWATSWFNSAQSDIKRFSKIELQLWCCGGHKSGGQTRGSWRGKACTWNKMHMAAQLEADKLISFFSVPIPLTLQSNTASYHRIWR